MGRPKQGINKTDGYRLRLTSEEKEMLDRCSEILNRPKSKIVMEALEEYYKENKIQEEPKVIAINAMEILLNEL